MTHQNTGLSWWSFCPPPSLSLSVCLPLALSLLGSDMHCCPPCISSSLTLSYLDILTRFVSFSICTSFLLILFSLPLLFSTLFTLPFYFPACVSFFLCMSLSLSFSPLIGYCGFLSLLHCYGFCKRHYYESSIFNVSGLSERDTGRPFNFQLGSQRIKPWPEHILMVCACVCKDMLMMNQPNRLHIMPLYNLYK